MFLFINNTKTYLYLSKNKLQKMPITAPQI